ncbi:MAG: dihydropyrimidinase [candidate division Zixibacteria bacterium CG_4_9_14_3_um_filter_46_8]|nr:MAG: dihydropyrimidinase [candidate division Zixibacteria bacterium CG_4_9_14_3_um_filter_46_8]
MDIIIKNGTIVTGEGTFKADIGIEKEKIAAIANRIDADGAKVIDATGKLVMPGAIDVHVHFQLPFCGTVSADDFENGTKAAACGGVTSIIDFAIQKKGQSLLDAVSARKAEADGKVCVDYSLHAVPTDWNPNTPGEMEKLASEGITSFKMFMIYAKEGMISDDDALFSALETVSHFGGIVGVHAESVRVLDLLIARYHNEADMKQYGAYCHVLSRPNFIEAEAISRAVTWSEATGGKLYIVHMSTGEGANIISNAHKRGIKVFAETCPQYLLLNDSVFKQPNGHLYATCPQIKKNEDSERLWDGLASGDVSTIATDTCTFDTKQKAMWDGDFTKIPFGLPGVETLLPLAYTYGVGQGKITLQRLVQLVSTNPAKLMGMYPQKGSLSVNTDADIVIFDPNREVKLSYKDLQTNCDWSPYEGFQLRGYPSLTICRGKVVAENGKFCGKIGFGKFIKRVSGFNEL